MIYVIQVRYEDITLLKIGYTGELKKETRYASYRLHNPMIEILYEIPEGDEEDEKYLHYYFNEFKFKDYGNEWFIKDSMILDYFETHKTKESLQDLRGKDLVVDLKSFGIFRNKVRSIINRVINLRVSSGDITLEKGLRQLDSMTDNILYNHRIRCEDRLLVFIEKTFGYSRVDIFPELENNITEFLAKFDSLNFFTDKMKALCESGLTSHEISTILELIPIDYKNFYITLGKEKIRSLSYQKSKLKLEYEKQMSNQLSSNNLLNLIYSSFVIGNKYTKSHIKKVLADIYFSLNISTTPKATDLEKYFELKLVDVIDETGKRTKGFKLISKKN